MKTELKQKLRLAVKNQKNVNKMDNKTIENIQDRIIKLPFQKQLAFVYFHTESIFLNYFAFYKMENWGNPKVLQNAIKTFQNIILESRKLSNEDKLGITELETITPDTDDFTNFLSSLALDVCASLLEVFAFLEDKNNQHIIDVSTSAIDLAQMFIEFRDKKHFDDYVFDDELIKYELNKQLQILELLENTETLTQDFLLKTEIEKSRLGSLIIGVSNDDLMKEFSLTEKTKLLKPEFRIDEDVYSWLEMQKININEFIPELLRSFYQTMKAAQKNAAF